jgi:hypothetical protein
MTLDLLNFAPAAVCLALAALALPWIQLQQDHQAIDDPLASYTPELMMSATRAGPHTLPRQLNDIAVGCALR